MSLGSHFISISHFFVASLIAIKRDKKVDSEVEKIMARNQKLKAHNDKVEKQKKEKEGDVMGMFFNHFLDELSICLFFLPGSSVSFVCVARLLFTTCHPLFKYSVHHTHFSCFCITSLLISVSLHSRCH